jgi:hypothetical protein
MSEPRYKLLSCSDSGHCCFDYTIVDTHRNDVMDRGYNWVCEAMEEEYATLVLNALNKSEEALAFKPEPPHE